MMRPLVGRSIPVSIFSSVDFPLPDGPIMLNRLCAGMVQVTSSKLDFIHIDWTKNARQSKLRSNLTTKKREERCLICLQRLYTCCARLKEYSANASGNGPKCS